MGPIIFLKNSNIESVPPINFYIDLIIYAKILFLQVGYLIQAHSSTKCFDFEPFKA